MSYILKVAIGYVKQVTHAILSEMRPVLNKYVMGLALKVYIFS